MRLQIRRLLLLTQRQYLYFCTSKASNLRCEGGKKMRLRMRLHMRSRLLLMQRQYLYLCTSKASNLSAPIRSRLLLILFTVLALLVLITAAVATVLSLY
jgi:hypothetical protein